MDSDAAFLLGLYRAARELPVAEFQARVFALLKGRIPFSSGMWGSGELRPGAGLVIDSIHLENQPAEMLAAYEEVKHNDIVALEARRRLGDVVNVSLQDVPHRRSYGPVLFHSHRFEMQQTLVTTHHERSQSSIDFLTLWRSKDANRFTVDDERRYASIIPHCFEAGRINRLLSHHAPGRRATLQPSAVAGMAGNLYSHDPAFDALLRREWPLWEPPLLPPPMLAALTRSNPPRFTGARISAVAQIQSGMLFVRVRERVAREDLLTTTERRVAGLVARGRTYKNVASELGVSPATVRNQMHSAYQKLKVNSKFELARLLGTLDL